VLKQVEVDGLDDFLEPLPLLDVPVGLPEHSVLLIESSDREEVPKQVGNNVLPPKNQQR
jgi:hypothetical protein